MPWWSRVTKQRKEAASTSIDFVQNGLSSFSFTSAAISFSFGGASFGSRRQNRILPSDCVIRDARTVLRHRLKNSGSNTLYKQVRVARMRRVVKRIRGREKSGKKGERRAQFLLNKEVSRTKQLMSLRLGGPARGFVLITSRRESERGEIYGGERRSLPLFPLSLLFSLTFFLPLFFHIPFSVPLSPSRFFFFFRSFITATEEERKRTAKK